MLTLATLEGDSAMQPLLARPASVRSRLATRFARLWRTDAPLTATGLLMLALLPATLLGLWLDPRTITNAPAWLKPAKFAVSIAIYSLTLAWVFTYLGAWRRTRRVVSWTTAAVLTMEFVLIAAQAWRGRASHFNVGTAVDASIFATMGIAIVIQTIASVGVAVALWRQPFQDRALGWALRLGMTISILGAASAGFMTSPTAAQREAARSGLAMTVAGAHTVGAPDGGPGIAGTGWSREHGDVRVPHFFGLHALQALPLLAWLLRRRAVAAATRVPLTQVAGLSYLGLFALLLWQALSGESLVAPDAGTIAALLVWAAGTAAAAWLAAARINGAHARAVASY
jgi:hypothetical protein